MLTQEQLEKLVWKAMLDYPIIGDMVAEGAKDRDQAYLLLDTFKETLAEKLARAIAEEAE